MSGASLGVALRVPYSTEHDDAAPRRLFFLIMSGSAATMYKPYAEPCILPSNVPLWDHCSHGPGR